jgi:uncharacterized protein YdeI (YjbR/CyaY-like superfamily)
MVDEAASPRCDISSQLNVCNGRKPDIRARPLSAMVRGMSEHRGGLPILLFRDSKSFEEWLSRQPADASGAWLKLPKKSSAEPGLTNAGAIDAALCFGWIDGQLGKYDDEFWLIRFTPRRARSKWSQANKQRATELLGEGRIRSSGLAEIEAAKADGRWDAAYAPASSATVPADFQDALDASPKAGGVLCNAEGREPIRDPLPPRFREAAGDEGQEDRGLCRHAGARRDHSWVACALHRPVSATVECGSPKSSANRLAVCHCRCGSSFVILPGSTGTAWHKRPLQKLPLPSAVSQSIFRRATA